MKIISREVSQLENKLNEILGNTWSKVKFHSIRNSLPIQKLKQLKTKTKKLMRLRSKKSQNVPFDFKFPIINLSSFKNLKLEELEESPNHGFFNKQKGTRRNLVLELGALAEKAVEYVKNDEKESFHEFLRKITNSLAKNFENSKNDTFHQLEDESKS